MIRIGIELNGVIRNINKQYLKYYTKDINPTFDDTTVDLNDINLINKLPFESENARRQFIFEDYPFELFGVAPSMSMNLHTYITSWAYELYEYEGFDDVTFFSLGEEELTIQSTFHYLSKSGSRVRKVLFPRDYDTIWENFDVVITCNEEIIKIKPQNKIVIFINNKLEDIKQTTDILVYEKMEDVIKDKNLINNLKTTDIFKKNTNYFVNSFYKIKKYIRRIKKWRMTA